MDAEVGPWLPLVVLDADPLRRPGIPVLPGLEKPFYTVVVGASQPCAALGCPHPVADRAVILGRGRRRSVPLVWVIIITGVVIICIIIIIRCVGAGRL